MANTTTKAKAKSSDRAEHEEADILKEEKIVAKDIDPEQYVVVRNGIQGRLVYRSAHTGEKYVWEDFGAEQEIQLRELKNAKNSNKKFFMNNWFMFNENWVIDYLGVRQFYNHAINIDDFDDLFALRADELKERLGALSEGQKKSVKYRALELIASGEIDSRKTVAVLEDALGVELIEK